MYLCVLAFCILYLFLVIYLCLCQVPGYHIHFSSKKAELWVRMYLPVWSWAVLGFVWKKATRDLKKKTPNLPGSLMCAMGDLDFWMFLDLFSLSFFFSGETLFHNRIYSCRLRHYLNQDLQFPIGTNNQKKQYSNKTPLSSDSTFHSCFQPFQPEFSKVLLDKRGWGGDSDLCVLTSVTGFSPWNRLEQFGVEPRRTPCQHYTCECLRDVDDNIYHRYWCLRFKLDVFFVVCDS